MWDSVVDQARSEGRSVSAYLLNIHCEHLGCLGNEKWKNSHNMDGKREEINAPGKSVLRRLIVQKGEFFNPNPKKGE